MNPRGTASSSQRGIILVEALLAVLVLVLGFLTLYHLLAPNLRHRHVGQQSLGSACLAKDIMATLRAQSLESSHAGNWMDFWSDFSSGGHWLYLNGETDTNNAFVANALMTNRVSSLNRFRVHVPVVAVDADRIPVLVQVWPGETGPLSSSNAFSLYAEFDNPGGL